MWDIDIKWLDDKNGLFNDDRDGHEYKIIKIGPQIWMAENLAFTIPENEPDFLRHIIDTKEWKNNTSGDGWCYFQNNKQKYKDYGVLYNWKAAGNACPFGWDIPSNKDWLILAEIISENKYAYEWEQETNVDKVAKEVASELRWKESSSWGHREYDGQFCENEKSISWWSSSHDQKDKSATSVYISSDSSLIHYLSRYWWEGHYVRCILGETASY